jgi:glycosyltransferase involved in cell wall biosynthesis
MMPQIWDVIQDNASLEIHFHYKFHQEYDDHLRALGISGVIFTPFGNRFRRISLIDNDRPKLENKFLNYLEFILIRILYYPLFIYDIYKFYLYISKIKPDIVHINNGGYPGSRSARSFAIACKLRKVSKIIFVVNNTAIPYKYFYRLVEWPLDQIVKKSVTTFVTASKFARLALIQTLKIPNSKAVQIYNCTPIAKFSNNNFMQNRLGFDANTFIIGIFGQLIPRKGQIEFIKLFSRIVKKLDIDLKIKILIVGSGNKLNEIYKLITFLQVDNYFVLIPENRNFLQYMSICDLILQPSLENEDLPTTLNWALQLGKPVMGTNVGGINEIILPSINGFIIDLSNSEDFLSKLNLLILDKELLKTFSDNSRMLWNRLLRPDRVIPKYLKLYGLT